MWIVYAFFAIQCRIFRQTKTFDILYIKRHSNIQINRNERLDLTLCKCDRCTICSCYLLVHENQLDVFTILIIQLNREESKRCFCEVIEEWQCTVTVDAGARHSGNVPCRSQASVCRWRVGCWAQIRFAEKYWLISFCGIMGINSESRWKTLQRRGRGLEGKQRGIFRGRSWESRRDLRR